MSSKELSPSSTSTRAIPGRSTSTGRLTHLHTSDKGGIILDIGTSYTRIGMSGESTPRFIIPTVAHLQQDNKYVRIADVSLSDVPYLRRVLRWFIRDIYVKYLLVHPKDHRVIVLEDLACPSAFRNTLASLLFEEFKVPYATFVPNHLMCLFAIGRQSLLVVRVGYSETTVLPIYEGIPIVSAWQESPVGAKHFHNSVAESLRKNGSIVSRGSQEPQERRPVTEDDLKGDLENIAVRTCFVRPRGREDTPPNMAYPLSGGDLVLTLDGKTRAFSGDVFFGSETSLSVAILILDSLKKCSIDCRKELAENIAVVGGVVSTSGFMSRMKEELMACLEDDFLKYNDVLKMKTFKFHKLPVPPNCVEWMGGSVFGSQEKAVLERAVTPESFQEHKQLPDWMSPDPKQREELHLSLPGKKTLSTGSLGPRRVSPSPSSSLKSKEAYLLEKILPTNRSATMK